MSVMNGFGQNGDKIMTEKSQKWKNHCIWFKNKANCKFNHSFKFKITFWLIYLYTKDCFFVHINSWYRNSKWRNNYIFETPKITFIYNMLQTKAVNLFLIKYQILKNSNCAIIFEILKNIIYCNSTPFALHSRKTFGCPACFFTVKAFWVRWQISFSPVMKLWKRLKFAIRHIRSGFTTIVYGKNLTINVYIICTYWI